jgi:Divergent InlB B-repeat domain/Beta-propeller repeat
MRNGLIFILLFTFFSAHGGQLPLTVPQDTARLAQSYGQLPLSFEINQGQTDKKVKFISRGQGYTLFLTPTEAVLALRKVVEQPDNKTKKLARSNPLAKKPTSAPSETLALQMQLVGANPNPLMDGLEELPGKVNYLKGNDPKQWQSNVTTYSKVRYQAVYPGIDLLYYGKQRQLEYDFVVQPGADPKAIRLNFAGAESARLDAAGDLLLLTKGGEVRLQKPVVYQTIDGQRRDVAGQFVLHEVSDNSKGQQVGFAVAAYDTKQPLVIDPVLAYSSYLGGSGDWGGGIAVDSSGNAYVTGSTSSTDFPTVNAKYPKLWGSSDAFVTKFNATGSKVLYSTYLGGSSGEVGRGIAVDSSGNAYVTGSTSSTDFPTVNAKYPKLWGYSDAFVTKFNATGSKVIYSTYLGGNNKVIYSTYLGGNNKDLGNFFEEGENIAVDSFGNAYVTGRTSSTDFPTVNAKYPKLWGSYDAFVTKFNASGSKVLYSTYLGGSGNEFGLGIAVDSAGNAYVTGATGSSNFPTVNAKYPKIWGGSDAFVTKFNASGSKVLYSTYLGGSGNEFGLGIAVDSAGNAYVTGYTQSADFPTVNAKYPKIWGGRDAFVTKFNASGSKVLYSTYMGGSRDDYGSGIAVDSVGNAYVTGVTEGDFPMVNAKYLTFWGSRSTFVVEFNSTGTKVLYSTYLGGVSYTDGEGIAVDSAGNAYVTGNTYSSNFPTHANDSSIVSYDSSYSNGIYSDVFVAKFSSYAISTSKQGTGSGTVNSNPAGINCGTECAKVFPPQETVTLTATPDANSHFVRWEGDCGGTQTNCTITVNEDKRAIAVFDTDQPLSAQPLIDSLTKLKTQMLLKVDSDLAVTARAFGDSKNLQRSLVWSDWFGTLLNLVTDTLSTISTAIDVVSEVPLILTNGFVTADTEQKAMLWLYTAQSIYENQTTSGKNLQLAIDGPAYASSVKTMLKKAYDDACVTVGVCVEFNQTVYETVIKNWLNSATSSMIVTLHQNGDTRRKKSRGASGVTNAKQQIAAKLQTTINALIAKGTVPATFPMQATLDMLNQVRNQVGLSQTGDATAIYDAMLNDGTQLVKHSEKVSLGRIGNAQRWKSIALEHFSDNISIQMVSTIKTIPDSTVNGLNILLAQQSYKLSNGTIITMSSYGYLTALLDFQLAAQQKVSTMDARKGIDYAPEQMLNSFGEELSNLWMIADDVSNKILLDAQ